MPKMKSKKALKTHKQKRHLRKETTVSSADMKRIKYLIQQ